MQKLIFTFMVCITGAVFASENDEREFSKKETPTIQTIISDEIFTAEGISSDGKKIYFGIELISDKNKSEWERFCNFTCNFSRFCFSSRTPQKDDLSHFTEEEYIKFIELKEKRYHTLVEKGTLKELLIGLSGGAGNCDLIHQNPCYITYISKKPVNGYFQHPFFLVNENGYEEGVFEKFYKGYQDLVMCIRSLDVKHTDVYNNRGIFRTLQNLLEGGYSNLSLDLHGIIALFFKKYGKTHMSVQPLPKMFEMIISKIPSHKIYVNEDMSDIEHNFKFEKIPQNLHHFSGSIGICDTYCVIEINALIDNIRKIYPEKKQRHKFVKRPNPYKNQGNNFLNKIPNQNNNSKIKTVKFPNWIKVTKEPTKQIGIPSKALSKLPTKKVPLSPKKAPTKLPWVKQDLPLKQGSQLIKQPNVVKKQLNNLFKRPLLKKVPAKQINYENKL